MAGSFFIGTKIHRDNSEQTRAQIFMGLAHGVCLSLLCPKDVLLWPRTIHCMNSSGLMRTGGYLSGERKRPRHKKREKPDSCLHPNLFLCILSRTFFARQFSMGPAWQSRPITVAPILCFFIFQVANNSLLIVWTTPAQLPSLLWWPSCVLKSALP